MARIAIGGWQHETNTFAPLKADFEAFQRPGGRPARARPRICTRCSKPVNAREGEFAGKVWDPGEAVTEARRLASNNIRPGMRLSPRQAASDRET